jgi:hypothetical protein
MFVLKNQGALTRAQKDILSKIDFKRDADNLSISLKIKASDFEDFNMLTQEALSQFVGNRVSGEMTDFFVENHNLNEDVIYKGNTKYYNKGASTQVYECLHGQISISRNVYQTAEGGTTYCPLEESAGVINNAMPLYSKILASKAARMSFRDVKNDMMESLGRKVSERYVKTNSDAIALLALAKEEVWTYQPPEDFRPEDVVTISTGLDGTCVYLITSKGWREALVASISLIDKYGERLHTIYLGASPEYGKAKFLSLVNAEWDKVVNKYPNALRQGLADGASWIWDFLKDKTDIQVLDFFHLSEYIAKAAGAIFSPSQTAQSEEFKKDWCHEIKHHNNGVSRLIKELENIRDGKLKDIRWDTRKKIDVEELGKVIAYLKNQAEKTKYKNELDANRPIGSGVTEAACKRLIKGRMCHSGMRWTEEGAANIIALRALVLTAGRWEQFWNKIMRSGGYYTLMGKRPK